MGFYLAQNQSITKNIILLVVQVVQTNFGLAVHLHRYNQRRKRCCYSGLEEAKKNMSIVQNPIMGQMRKSYANVNTYVCRGQNVISAKVFNRKDVNSEAQQAHRAGFKLVSDTAQVFSGFLNRGFPVRPERLTAHNLFMKLNLTTAIDNSEGVPVINYSLIQVSKGSLAPLLPTAVVFNEGVLELTADTNIDLDGVNATDLIQVLVGTTNGNLYALQQERGSEATISLSMNLTNVVKADIKFVYLYVRLASGKKVSNSVFVLPE